MDSNFGRTLVFVFVLVLVVDPVLPTFAAFTDDSLHYHAAVGDENAPVEMDHCVERSLCDGQCCASCASCVAVSLAGLPATLHTTAIPGSTVSLLKTSLAIALYTGPPRIPT